MGLLLAAVVGLCPASVGAEEQARPATAAAATSSDEEAVRRSVEAYRKAVESGDTEAIAEFWSPEADYVDFKGRAFKIDAALIRARNQAREDGHIARPAPKTETLAVRLITPDVAVEDGTVERGSATGDGPALGATAPCGSRKMANG